MKHLKKILAIASLGAMALALCFTGCGEKTPENPTGDHEHTFSEEWEHDATNHWHEAICAHKNEQGSKAAHTFKDTVEGTADCTHGAITVRTCTVCGYTTSLEGAPLGHDWEDFEEEPATCLANGHTAYRECKVCHAREGYKVLMKTNHRFSTAWEHDNDNHWHPSLCECDQRSGQAAHNFNNPERTCVCGLKDPTAGQDEELEALYVFEEPAGKNYVVLKGLTAEGAKLTSITLPERYKGKNVTEIAAGAFRGNTTLQHLALTQNITTIGDFAFENCTALQDITLPAVTTLGTFDYQVFNGCTALKAVTLPSGVTVIGQNMFKNCKDLATVTVNGNVTKVDTQAFYGCEKLEALTLSGNLSYLGQKAFAKSGIKTLEVKMADGGRIAQGAFEECGELTTLSITGGIHYFASPVLKGCSKLQTLTLPFVGNYDDAAKATDTHFGYIFGKTDGAYDIPETLETVNVKGGSVELGAFENCGTITVNADDGVIVKTKTFTGYTGTFNWNGTLPGPTVELHADQENIFKDDSVTVTYTVTPNYDAPNNTTVTVGVKKDDADATLETDYTVAENVYTFKTIGTYTITVTAIYNGITVSKSVTIMVADRAAAPEIVASAANATLTEGDNGTTLTVNVTYADGDSEKEDGTTYSVFVKEKGSDNYVNAEANWYEFAEDTKTFKAKVAGDYRITVKVMSTKGGFASQDVDITVNAVELEGTLDVASSVQKTNGWVRLATGTPAELAYTVTEGTYTEGYEVVYTATNGATANAGTGSAVSVSLAEPNTSIVSVTYVHKNEALEKSFTLEIPVSFVTNVETAPVLGEDPFGGTYGTVIPSMGLLLYFDIEDDGEQLSYSQVEFSIVSHDVEVSSGTLEGVEIGYLYAEEKDPPEPDVNFPFILVRDFKTDNDNRNTAHGTITVKVAAKDGSVAATKVFTVTPMPTNEGNDLYNYLDKVIEGGCGDAYKVGMSWDIRQNAVVTKDGVIAHREAHRWSLGGRDIMALNINRVNNFRVDFTFSLIKRVNHDGNNKASFAVNYRLSASGDVWNGWNGSQSGFYAQDDSTTVGAGYWGDNTSYKDDYPDEPAATIGKVYHVRLTHTLEDGVVKFEWTWSETGDEGSYKPWFDYTVPSSTEEGNMGAPITYMSILHECGMVCIGGAKITNLDG